MPAIKRTTLYLLLVLCSFKLQAQTQPTEKYKLFFEKVYLHTDRELYSGGEDVWFKAYLVNAQNNQPIGSSNNLYVELITPQAEIMNREIVRLDHGTGNGDFKLNDSIPTGKYRIRAYTNWMRNFGDNFVFEKNIDIINPNGKKQDALNKLKPGVASAAPVVSFYPEGGSLVDGVSSIVAVKAQDAKGKGLALYGSVLNAAGDTLTHFSTDTLGMGLFTLMPLKGQVYHAVFKQRKRDYEAELPVPLLKGLSLSIMRSDTLITAIITANDAALTEYMGMRFILTGKHGGILCLRKPVQINGSQTVLRIPKSFFPEGITDLSLYDAQNKPHSERLIFIHHTENSLHLNVSTDKPQYQPREKVALKLKLSDSTQKANLSLAVVDAAIAQVPSENIETYLMLQSELKGRMEQPARYFDTTNLNRFKQMDMLLLTQGWRDFVWRRIADSAIRISYNAENSFTVSGRVRQKLADKPIAGMNITLTAFKAKGQKLYSTKTDSTGRYNIDGLQLYGPQPLSLTARNNKGQRAGWLLMDSLTKDPVSLMAQAPLVIDTMLNAVKAFNKREINIKNAARSKLLKEVKITENKTVVLSNMSASSFGYIDQVFSITKKDEYYQALDNWLAHNVKGAIINDNPGVLFVGRGGPGYLKGLMYPRFIVNGREVIPTNGTYIEPPQFPGKVILDLSDPDIQMETTMRQQYFDLTMDKIKRVELKHLVGHDPDRGSIIDVYVLYLDVTADAFENKDFGLENATVNGYYEARKFYKPLYDVPTDQTKPDLRNTIHWEPNITTDAHGEASISFYNADPKSKVRIIVQGITDKGVPVSAMAGYVVK